MVKDSTYIFSVSATNATSYVWNLPNGWSGTSTTNTISAIPGSVGGTISVIPYNGTVAGAAVYFQTSVIDFVKVDIT